MTAMAREEQFRTSMAGRCDARTELAGTPIALAILLTAVPVMGGRQLVRELLEPLGWCVAMEVIPLDPAHSVRGGPHQLNFDLEGTVRQIDALRQVNGLLPLLDGSKRYWVCDDEATTLLVVGQEWLAELHARGSHHEPIPGPSAGHGRGCPAAAGPDGTADQPRGATALVDTVANGGSPAPLNSLRSGAVMAALDVVDTASVVDHGCGEGVVLRPLSPDQRFTDITGEMCRPKPSTARSNGRTGPTGACANANGCNSFRSGWSVRMTESQGRNSPDGGD